MKKYSALLILFSMLLSACGNQSSGTEDASESKPKVTEEGNILHRQHTLHVVDTVQSGSNVYILTINREACDSLPIVTDEMGFRFTDNLLDISVRKNGRLLFDRTFKKTDFRSMLDEDFLKQSILDGCRFMQVHEGMVSFSLAVSYPESDMSRPFILNIGPDGSYMIVKDDSLEEDYPSESGDSLR